MSHNPFFTWDVFMRWTLRFCLLMLTLWVAACGGGGHPVAPPTDFKVQAVGDTQVTLNWTSQPGVDYWVWFAPGTAMDDKNYDRANAWTKVSPPFVLKGTKSGQALVNGTTYSFTINARVGDAPGGAPAPIVTATPRLAGQTWSAGPDVNGQTLRGVTSAALTTGVMLVGVGDSGQVQVSTDNVKWTVLSSSSTSKQLNDVLYAYGKFIAVGAGGTIIYSSDGQVWTAAVSQSAQDLNALYYNGSRLVAVGQGGTVLTSTDGVSWKAVAVDGLMQNLAAVTYSSSGYWLAAGSGGAVYSSTDGLSWKAIAMPTEFAAATWKSAAVLARSVTSGSTLATLYVSALVGQSGQIATSTDGVTWSQASLVASSTNLNKVVSLAGQFMAVGDGGAIFNSPDGVTWTARESYISVPLRSVLRFDNAYTVYGQSGVTAISR
jgi:hypothetical protein